MLTCSWLVMAGCPEIDELDPRADGAGETGIVDGDDDPDPAPSDMPSDDPMPGDDEGDGGSGGMDEGGDPGLANAEPAPEGSCGDLAVQRDEDCDGWNLGFESCLSLGYVGGQLGCHDDCSFDESGCIGASCGNNIIDLPELCDGSPYPCWLLGYEGAIGADGLAPCQSDCLPDESACNANCSMGEPGCFCDTAFPCGTGYACVPNSVYQNAPGTCRLAECTPIGKACETSGMFPACCGGGPCVDDVCI